jgi:hypothetical protein
MISNDRIFKRGDVIVSGFGNIRILVGETGNGVAGDGARNVFYDALTMYCESDAPAGTDMRYARHATEKEKKMFFETLKSNGLVYDAKTCTIKAGENYKGVETENVKARKNTKGPLPFKVVKKRVRPTLSQVRFLEEKVRLLDEIVDEDSKEKVKLKEHLSDMKACNEKYANELKRLESDNKELREKKATLDQSNNLMKIELDRLRDRLKTAEKGWREGKEEVERLNNRGFWARLFNW